MIKISGALISILGALILGVSMNINMTKELSTVNSMIQALELMTKEISEYNAPLRELFVICAERTEGKIRNSFMNMSEELKGGTHVSVSELWKSNVAAHFSFLDSAGRLSINSVGDCLGRYDTDSQLSQINKCIAELSLKAHQLRDIYADRLRLNMLMPVAGALFLVIMIA